MVKSGAPLLIRLACWAYNTKPERADARWIPACLAIAAILFWPMEVGAKYHNHGLYEPFHYRDWKYPYDARNKSENIQPDNTHAVQMKSIRSKTKPPRSAKIEKLREPRFLCFLDDNKRGGMNIMKTSEGKILYGLNSKTDFVLVSYTGVQFPQESDLEYLHEVGKHAARKAGTKAYWISCSCVEDTKDANDPELEHDIWTICDVVRSANSVVVAVNGNSNESTDKLLERWSKRVWILPEWLLGPGHSKISVYRGKSIEVVRQLDRRDFPIFGDDKGNDRDLLEQLVDHHEGSVHLTALEYVSIALGCLQSRDTTEHLKGDKSYVLMGLLRQRPEVVGTDSAFQAFARLSLANDSDLLLERLICMLPYTDDHWHSMADQWGVSLWDINPKCQVCGIGEGDAVILDGVHAAPIAWSFAPVNIRRRETTIRKILRYLFRLTPILILFGIALLATGVSIQHSQGGPNNISNGMYGGAGASLGIALIVITLSPFLILTFYHGKVWEAQPWLFGIEGYMEIKTLEEHIFGDCQGRLRWSVASSVFSRHEEEQNHPRFCTGVDPMRDQETKNYIDNAAKSGNGEAKIFTLVDTVSMTVTLFAAAKPPIAALVCGEEGGMQRAVLCSYEWRTNTLYRETVLRMTTPVYDKMPLTNRVKLALYKETRPQKEQAVETELRQHTT
ncbi:MAG: hypothetical protein Q9187_003023 [Circinaria calcarea]